MIEGKLVKILKGGVLQEDKFFGDGCAINWAVVPFVVEALVVISMKVGEHEDEGVLGVGLGDVELVNEDV